jgi:hypothetical protein
MSSARDDSTERGRRLHEVIAAYLETVRAGQVPDRQDLLLRHPDLADELRAFLADHDQFQHLAAPAPAEVATPSPTEPAAKAFPGGMVRYFGDYELLERIAEGGMGVVWRARQVSLNRVVALKMIRAGELATGEEVQRFRFEAQAAGNLKHPHIVPIHEVGEHHGLHYFSMDLIDGGSLAETVGRPLEPLRMARLMAVVARAVHYAHQRGLLHRDLKPANILLDAQGEPHVTDFGLAERVAAQAESGQAASGIVGTPGYMAPEQVRAEKLLSTAVDVYGLGAILYELLTGRPPFRAPTAFDTMLQVLEQEPARPRSLNPKADRDLETICLKCLEKDPKERYGSAEALAEDLDRWQRGEPILARPVGTAERIAKWVKRRPAAAALVAGAVLMAVGLGTVWVRSEHVGALAARAELNRYLEEERQRVEDQQRAQREAEAGRPRRDRQLARVAVLWEKYPQEALRLLEDEQQIPSGLRDPTWEAFHRLCRLDRGPLAHGKALLQLVASADGKTVLALNEGGGIRVWDSVKNREVRLLNKESDMLGYDPAKNPRPLALTADGSLLAVSDGEVILLQPTGLGQPRIRGMMGTSDGTPVFSPDGKVVAAHCLNFTSRFDELDEEAGPAFVASAVGLLGSSSGRGPFLAASALFAGRTVENVYLFDPQTGSVIAPNGFGEKNSVRGITAMAFAPDSKTLAMVARDGKVQLWDAEVPEGRLRAELQGHPGTDFGLAFTPDGNALALRCDQPPDPGGRQRLPVVLILDVPEPGERTNGPPEPGR